MKEVTPIQDSVYQIESEPGDATRYSYFVFKNYDDYCFMPCNSTFRFPQRLNYYDVQELSEEELILLAQKENCNPWTLKECIRTIIELQEETK